MSRYLELVFYLKNAGDVLVLKCLIYFYIRLNIQSSVEWRKEITRQVFGARCKEETSIIETIVLRFNHGKSFSIFLCKK